MKPYFAVITISSLALAGCTATATPPITTPNPTQTVPATAVDDFDLGPVAADVLLVVKATATAPNGAALDLELRVRRPVSFDDVGGYTVPAAAIASCPELLTTATAAQQLWTFTRVNVSAISEGDLAWPSDASVTLRPSAQNAPIASMSFLGEASGTGMPCQLDKFVMGQGKGAISIGTSNDAQELTAGGFRRWAQLNYGFATEGSDVTLTDCTFELTAMGTDLGGGNAWSDTTDTHNCVTGAATPASVY